MNALTCAREREDRRSSGSDSESKPAQHLSSEQAAASKLKAYRETPGGVSAEVRTEASSGSDYLERHRDAVARRRNEGATRHLTLACARRLPVPFSMNCGASHEA